VAVAPPIAIEGRCIWRRFANVPSVILFGTTVSRNPTITKDASLIVIDGEARPRQCLRVFPPVRCARRCHRNLLAPTRLIVVGDGKAARAVAADIAARGQNRCCLPDLKA